MHSQSTDHGHPDLERRVARLETELSSATVILLDIRNLLDTRLGALDVRLGGIEVRLGGIEDALRQSGSNGASTP